MPEQRRGVWYGIAAYGMWGLFPLYWPLLEPAGAAEILAHRIAWSLVVVVAILAAGRRWRLLARTLRDPRRAGMLALAATVIAGNWLVYIWGVNNGHVVETSLGYFINPLVTVMLGVLLFRERLRPAQWAALGLGAVAVVVLTAGYGRPPWIALALAASFSTYSLLKKTAQVGAAESLAVETAVLFGPAVAFLAALELRGSATFGHVSADHAVLLAGCGVITVLPLLCFGAAAIRVPLSTIGLLQYLTPSMQFAIGVLVFAETVPPARLAGFALVWVALAVLTVDALRRGRPGRPDRSNRSDRSDRSGQEVTAAPAPDLV
jgi:chloramphenicol-sensitive protein RarD